MRTHATRAERSLAVDGGPARRGAACDAHASAPPGSLQQVADASPQVQALAQLQRLADGARPASHPSPALGIQINDDPDLEAEAEQMGQRAHSLGADASGSEAARGASTLPPGLRAGIAQLSGHDLAPVRVHYDSPRPARLDALAYAHGDDIHLAPGEEAQLPHEAWHLVQQRQGRVRATAQLASDDTTPVLEAYRGSSLDRIGHVSATAKDYEIARTLGVKVRAKPNGLLEPIGRVLYDTEVHVRATDTSGAFYFIIARNGVVGWINRDYVALDPPDPGARLHHITERSLTQILKAHYVDTGVWQLATGNDYTTLAAAVVVANQGRKGVSVDWAAVQQYKSDHPWKAALDPWMIDNFAIYHGSQLLAGHNIWLPSTAFVRALQASGVIGSRPGWINDAVGAGQSLAGFGVGLVSGVFGSLWDTLTGLWDLAKGVVDAVRSVLDGSLFASIQSLYDTLTSMTWEDVYEMAKSVLTMVRDALVDFATRWMHPDMYKRWHFRGYVIGAVALEVVLAIFTGGGTLAAKVLAKVGKYFPRLAKLLSKLLAAVDDLDFRRKHRKKTGHADAGDSDVPKDSDAPKDREPDEIPEADRAWEQARVMAALVTEENDLLDTPVDVLIPMLNTTIAARFRGVSRYQANPLGAPDTYEIVQLARRKTVDASYTAKKIPRFSFFTNLQGKSLKRLKERAKECDWKLTDQLRTGKGWYFTDDKGIERIRYRIDASGTYLHEETGYIRWTDEAGNFLDLSGRQVRATRGPIGVNMTQGQIRALCADEAEFDRVMRESHISVKLLGTE